MVTFQTVLFCPNKSKDNWFIIIEAMGSWNQYIFA